MPDAWIRGRADDHDGFAIVRIDQPDAWADDLKLGGGQGGVPNLLRGGDGIAVVKPIDEVAS
ncbi:MAG: hypothetical protein ACREYE_00615 [Gammaproteobacteria bacterium]